MLKSQLEAECIFTLVEYFLVFFRLHLYKNQSYFIKHEFIATRSMQTCSFFIIIIIFFKGL